MNDSIFEKLRILSDAAKYDVSCVSSGVERKNNSVDGIGNASAAGICHAWSADGRCISLLKILLTNDCIYDCNYCLNRVTNPIKRASFTPEEVAELTIQFYRRNYIEGLFLSSAIEKSPDNTMENILRVLELLRYKYNFWGYVHVKVIPGANNMLIQKTGMLADRMSVNIELPTKDSLRLLAPQKRIENIVRPMSLINNEITRTIEDKKHFGNTPRFVPGGQSTQMIIGATPDSDKTILSASQGLYDSYRMKRVFFSAYIPVISSPNLPAVSTMPPLLREHRLYQADWLMRFYYFHSNELFTEIEHNLDLEFDPKMMYALRNIDKFPIEINSASYEELLRIPGLGVTSAQRIVRERKNAELSYDSLKKMKTVLKRAKYFITVKGKYYGNINMEPNLIREELRLREAQKQLSIFELT
ncbi:putative DNA modification/repair radical SAM protein [Sedimentibacter hydroxybenzoicus DSM 7310]|uniref:DNA modification/repair radical SAM protein n=1 Tax=Sedimentibacter hydroxybenzoicus DSM 7310 TaxID=1123245 RepID=A0A974GV16_SEDHY|nr:putative DNA modification/repair radical SAM protein [Sedimentibacter hydroxybenzoicus]NYB72892.1 putative DNA modification/repair radical SAM protein [Sedimentibacter hydroxybenzoicus DSM 7310]